VFAQKFIALFTTLLALATVLPSACHGQPTAAEQADLSAKEKKFDLEAFKKSVVKPGVIDMSDPRASASHNYMSALQQTGWKYDRAKQFNEGEKCFEKLYKNYVNAFGEQNQETAHAMNQLAMHYERSGKYKLGEEYAKKCVEVEKKITPDAGSLIFPLQTLYHIYVDQDRDKDAEEICKEQLAIGEKAFGKKSAMVAGILEGYYDVLSHMGRTDEANAVKARAAEIRLATHTRQEHKVEATIK
jgi:tetratricopeptide (TPR) repeat protein